MTVAQCSVRPNRRAFLCALVLGVLSMAGCLSSVPKDADPRHLEINWAKNYAEARTRAKALSRPILLIGAAGDIVGEC